MLWVGLTGGIATGKSTVSRILKARGLDVIDADVLAREVVQVGTEGYREVVQAFGADAISTSGELNRKRIGEVVFSDPSKLALLESILHPRIRALTQQNKERLQKAGKKLGFYDVPLLFEKKMEPMFDRVVVVACSPELQLSRLIQREGFSEAEAQRRVAAQLPIAEKVARAHEVIRNEGTLVELEREVDSLLARLSHSPSSPS